MLDLALTFRDCNDAVMVFVFLACIVVFILPFVIFHALLNVHCIYLNIVTKHE